MTNTYTTRNEAIEAEIIAAIMSSGAVAHISEYDVDAIADEVLGDYHQGYASQVDAGEFWTIVEKHAK